MHDYALVLLQTAYSVNGCPLIFVVRVAHISLILCGAASVLFV